MCAFRAVQNADCSVGGFSRSEYRRHIKRFWFSKEKTFDFSLNYEHPESVFLERSWVLHIEREEATLRAHAHTHGRREHSEHFEVRTSESEAQSEAFDKDLKETRMQNLAMSLRSSHRKKRCGFRCLPVLQFQSALLAGDSSSFARHSVAGFRTLAIGPSSLFSSPVTSSLADGQNSLSYCQAFCFEGPFKVKIQKI